MFGKRKVAPAGDTLPGARSAGPGLTTIGGVRDPGCTEPATAGPARREIVQYLLDAYKDERGVHAETVLSCIGALAGFAAQMAVRKGMATSEHPVQSLLMSVECKSGRTFYFGDALNTIVAGNTQGQLSIWRFVAAPMVQAGRPLFDLGPIFKHVAETVDGPEFGVPSMGVESRLKELPIDSLKRNWMRVQEILEENSIQPLHWPMEIGVAAQDVIVMVKQTLDPALSARIVMESAIMMSKVNPAEVPGAVPQGGAVLPH